MASKYEKKKNELARMNKAHDIGEGAVARKLSVKHESKESHFLKKNTSGGTPKTSFGGLK